MINIVDSSSSACVILTWSALSPSALGELVVMALKMFTNTRKSVTSRAMRPYNRGGGSNKRVQSILTFGA